MSLTPRCFATCKLVSVTVVALISQLWTHTVEHASETTTIKVQSGEAPF